MSLTKLKLYVFLIVFLLICFLFLVDIIGRICPYELVSSSTDKPIVIVRNSDFLCTGISQIVSDGDNIYVLFGTYSVVQVYTHEGDYQYTISVYNHLNGRTEIATHENRLYIRDKIDNVYVFRNGVLTNFIDQNESAPITQTLSFGASDSAYSIRSGSIWHLVEDYGAKCVVQRPAFLFIYQNNLLFFIQFSLAILAGLVLFLPLPGSLKKA